MGSPSRRQLLKGGSAIVAAGAPVPFGGLTRPRSEILALGDSYTIGTSVAPDVRWISELAEGLRDNGFLVADPEVIAEAGWTTEELDHGIEIASVAGPYDLVTLLIGANDAFRGCTPDEFRPEFVALLDRSIEFAGGEPSNVVVMTIPDYTVTPIGQSNSPAENARRLESYNRLIREEAAETAARVVDLVPLSRRVTVDPELVSDDYLHPSPKQHDLWLTRILPAAIAALER